MTTASTRPAPTVPHFTTMRPSELDSIFHWLGLKTAEQRAKFLGRNERTVRRWMDGDQTVPQEIAMLLRLIYWTSTGPSSMFFNASVSR
jgi:DNA-binding transcriptional regulator YiaG